MRIWVVSMECAGIAEAGGVKNVTFSLCRQFAECGNDVTLFIPVFVCTSLDALKNVRESGVRPAGIQICGRVETVSYTEAEFASSPVRVVLVSHPRFAEKRAVYVYTEEEERENPAHERGRGHEDMTFLDTVFGKAVAEYGKSLPQEARPDIIHCHDASAAAVPSYIEQCRPECYGNTRCVVTIHNAGPAYHHEFRDISEAAAYTGLPRGVLEGALNGGRVEPFLLAAGNAALTTVSTFYAEELRDPANNAVTDGLSGIFSARGISVTGITNGIDFERYNPERTDISLLPYAFSPLKGDLAGKYRCRETLLALCSDGGLPDGVELFGTLSRPESQDGAVYFAYHGRVVWQKGITLFGDAAERVLEKCADARFVIMGQGDPRIERGLAELAERCGGKVVFLKGYNRAVARLVSASCDFIALPSYFEPCGLEDLIAQIFGTVPVAHATGGLKKITDGETGLLYSPNTEEALAEALLRAADLKRGKPELLKKMISAAAACARNEYSWETVARERYLPFFEALARKDSGRREAGGASARANPGETT